jgi:hypothetical protein
MANLVLFFGMNLLTETVFLSQLLEEKEANVIVD